MLLFQSVEPFDPRMLNYVFGAFGLSTLWLLPLVWRLLKSVLHRDPELITAPRGPAVFWPAALAVLLASTAIEGLLVWALTRNPASGAWAERWLGPHLSNTLGIGLSLVLMLIIWAAALPFYLGFSWRNLRRLAEQNPLDWLLAAISLLRQMFDDVVQRLPGLGRGARRRGSRRGREPAARSARGRRAGRANLAPVAAAKPSQTANSHEAWSELESKPAPSSRVEPMISEPWRVPKRDMPARPSAVVTAEPVVPSHPVPVAAPAPQAASRVAAAGPVTGERARAVPAAATAASNSRQRRVPPIPQQVRDPDEVFRARGRAPDPIADWLQKPLAERGSLQPRHSSNQRARFAVPSGISVRRSAPSRQAVLSEQQRYEDALQRFQAQGRSSAVLSTPPAPSLAGAVPTAPDVKAVTPVRAEAASPVVEAGSATAAVPGSGMATKLESHPAIAADPLISPSALSAEAPSPAPASAEVVDAETSATPSATTQPAETSPLRSTAVELAMASEVTPAPGIAVAVPLASVNAVPPVTTPVATEASVMPQVETSQLAPTQPTTESSLLVEVPRAASAATSHTLVGAGLVTAAASSLLAQQQLVPRAEPSVASHIAPTEPAEATEPTEPSQACAEVLAPASRRHEPVPPPALESDFVAASEPGPVEPTLVQETAATDSDTDTDTDTDTDADADADADADRVLPEPVLQPSLLPQPLIKKVSAPLPPLDLLSAPTAEALAVDEVQLAETGQLIEQRLKEFKVPVSVVGAGAGPVITRFEVEPAVGVRGNQVVALMKDLARGLGRTSIRVVETIPGKTCMGLELPNEQRQMIALSEILDSAEYRESGSLLTLAMGKGITGEPVVADLAKAPHMLVAGTTGSGKSVAVNAMILSLLYKATPEQVRLIMIDPKMLELSVYEGIPHLLAPVVTDMKLAANALAWCVGEMENRYRLMSELRVRNLAGFNQKVQDARAAGKPLWNPFPAHPEVPEYLDTLPMIVVVIDELADLMMVAGKKIEELIARLAQKARAAGIHLILATQRPSVDVITGLIKANIPTRVAFQVSSKIDSRTILDQMGAESLLGQGDMLFLPPGTGYPNRVHGAFVADEEVLRVVAFLKQFGEPDYIDAILAADDVSETTGESGSSEAGNAESDPLYDEAAEFVLRTRRASISFVQRQFRIGYNRAARLVEAMEAAGLVSSMGPNGQREVLAPSRAD